MDKRNIKLIIEFDGNKYAGWQIQNNANTVQETITRAIEELTGEEINLIGSSRTDAKVHARGFCANFITSSTIPPDKFKQAINNKLPEDIVIINSNLVSDDFHARYSSKGKKYTYDILNREQPPALCRNYMYFYKKKLDINKMKKAVEFFIGEHDFASFQNTGSNVRTTIRTIYDFTIDTSGDIISISITGNGFLYNMVRIIIGTLIQVGIGKIDPTDITEIINSRNRKNAGPTAPPQALCLQEVYY